MTTKQVVKPRPKKSKKKEPTLKEKLDIAIEQFVRRGITVPLLKEALVCRVDDAHRWKKTDMPLSFLPVVSEFAAALCQGDKCHFCGAAQVPIARESMFHFHPEYPLCDCLTPLRKVVHDYVESWHTLMGGRTILAQVTSGSLSPKAPIYQYTCSGCSHGPVIVTAQTVANTVRSQGRHVRRQLCQTCYQKHIAKKQAASREPQRKTAMREVAKAVPTATTPVEQAAAPSVIKSEQTHLRVPLADILAAVPKQGPAAKPSQKQNSPETGPMIITTPQPLTVSKAAPGAPTT